MATSTPSRARSWTLAVFATIGITAILAGVGFVWSGVSARPEPTRAETRLARSARHLLIPAAARARMAPTATDPDSKVRGRDHFADHCATCHGNDGKGRTTYGQRMYPRAPDMTAAATQALSDGELFWIIENGVRLTGMPGFGDDDPSNDSESWDLVAFIRHLPRLTPEDVKEMEQLNPTLSRAAVEHEREIEAFLAGEPVADEGHHH